MSKVIIALLLLLFSLVFILLFWIVVMALALLVFSKNGKKPTALHPAIKGG
jgi:cell division protein FtsL